MSLNANWVPMKWPCGPIEIARLEKSKSEDSDVRKTVDGWTQPAALKMLKGTPVNCLVVDWASGTADDAAQQEALRPLIAAGRQMGLSYVGKVAGHDNLAATVTAGRAAGLEAVLLDTPASHALDLPVIATFARDNVDWSLTTDIFTATGNVWPGVVLPTMRGDSAAGGPTVESFCTAIADARTYGSHWILSLDSPMRAGILNGDAQAMKSWARISETLSFFDAHTDWQAYKPVGVLAIVSDFTGANAFMSGETLNLISRRQVQFQIMDRKRALAGPVTGLKAILWVDGDAPTAGQHANLLAFINQGGTVIAPAYWGPAGAKPHRYDWLFDYDIYEVGKGRVVVASKGYSDPYLLARDTHLIVGRGNDLARLFNPGNTNCYMSAGSNGGTELVQIVNYARNPASYVALWVSMKPKGARLWTPSSGVPDSLGAIQENDGTSFHLPVIPVNCAVEIERSV